MRRADNHASPGNPVVVIRDQVSTEGRKMGRACWIWCPGCDQAHRPQIVGVDGDLPAGPCWDWNGREDEHFGIEPSLLVYSTIHLCPPDYVHEAPCPNPDSCGSSSHLVLSEEPRVLGHMLPHIVDPPSGNCHSFIRDGQWQFLGDSAHALAGQTVPLVPLPDWIAHLMT